MKWLRHMEKMKSTRGWEPHENEAEWKHKKDGWIKLKS